jgi:hypothetical protein
MLATWLSKMHLGIYHSWQDVQTMSFKDVNAV